MVESGPMPLQLPNDRITEPIAGSHTKNSTNRVGTATNRITVARSRPRSLGDLRLVGGRRASASSSGSDPVIGCACDIGWLLVYVRPERENQLPKIETFCSWM